MVLISVLIPAYNHEKFIKNTIQSIINQTYKNIELIVIDDGSKDSTWNVIQSLRKECEERFIRVVFQTQENAGTCTTLNRLLEKAQGEFLCIVASDDCMKAHACERMAGFLSTHSEYMLVVGDNEIIDGQGKKAYWDRNRNLVYQKEQAVYCTFADFLQKSTGVNFLSDEFGSYKKLYITNHIPNGYMIRKNIFDKIHGFTTEAPLEDWYLMLQISKYGKMKFINDVLFSYRWHGGNTILNNEKMDKICKKTKDYENKLLSCIDKKLLKKEVVEVIDEGVVYRSKKFLGFINVLYKSTLTGKIKEIRVMNKIIFQMYRK